MISSLFLPAAGNRNEGSLNNAGSWGNYWSRSLNTSNSNNAYNLNFNSSNIDWNNNNRYNGFSVRPVRVSSQLSSLAAKESVDVFFILNHTHLCQSRAPSHPLPPHPRATPPGPP